MKEILYKFCKLSKDTHHRMSGYTTYVSNFRTYTPHVSRRHSSWVVDVNTGSTGHTDLTPIQQAVF